MEQIENTIVRYRTWYKGIPPRPIKLEVPGWAGTPGYNNGNVPQPWHCKPFVDASTYGLELVYPFDAECVVSSNENGEISFEGDFSEDAKRTDIKLPPFMTFAPNHYGFTSSLDIETQPEKVLRIEPHPRFYTDTTGEVPIVVAGHIESEWWSRIFFVVFKSPRPGERHVFRKGEGYAQILILPKNVRYDVQPMTPAESLSRNTRDAAIVSCGDRIATHAYIDNQGNKFNNKYKTLSKICRRKGTEGVDNYLQAVATKRQKPMKKVAKLKFRKVRKKK